MARKNTARNYWRESDPDFNRHFKRRWFEPAPAPKPEKVRIVRPVRAAQNKKPNG